MQSGTPQSGRGKRAPVVVQDVSLSGGVRGTGESEPVRGRFAGMIPVVLVGRTNLEVVLRLDPSFEVYRAVDGPSAIGQASQIDLGPGMSALVVLAPESDPATRTAAFVQAVEKVAPAARVVRLMAGDVAGGSGVTGSADGGSVKSQGAFEVSARLSGSAMREVLRQIAATGEPAVSNATAEAVVEQVLSPRSAAKETSAPVAEPMDTPMLKAMLAGRDLLLAALEVIRRGVGASDVYFDEVSSSEVSGASGGARAGDGRRRVAVSHQSRVFGELVSSSASVEALGAWGEWLAHWLALREQQDQLRTAALVDDLTGAWNRRYFDGFLSAALKHASEHGHSVTVLYFDIDNFKHYNDRFGHDAGDEILRETVRLLQSVIRPTDRVCRIGGDEFGVIFHEPEGPREATSTPLSADSIWEIAKRFQRQVCEHRFPKLGELAPGTLTVSGGLASFPHDAGTAEELVKRADELALQAKRQGKNVITYGPGAERVCRVK